MTFDFPDGASNGQTYTASNGRVYRYNGITWVIDSVSTISNISEEFLSINGDGVVSGSSQLTSSFDERYVLSGSITQTTWDNIENKPAGIVSESTDLGSLNGFTSSIQIQVDGLSSETSSYLTSLDGAISSSSQVSYPSLSNIPSGIVSGSTQLTTSFPSKTTGTWTIPTGASTQSFTVDWNHSYQMWVIGNIPNGIISWIANVNVTNANVPIVGSQYGWYYVDGNALILTSIPAQIVGVNGVISTTSFGTTTSNTFEFGITNNSGTTQTINYGYIKVS
jgi:hypothetical protein